MSSPIKYEQTLFTDQNLKKSDSPEFKDMNLTGGLTVDNVNYTGADGVAGDVLETDGLGNATFKSRPLAGPLAGYAYETKNTQFSTIAIIPWDNSIPQATEGTQWFSVPYSPKFDLSVIVLKGCFILGTDQITVARVSLAVFDSTLGANSVFSCQNTVVNDYLTISVPIQKILANTSLTPRIFTVRFGVDVLIRTMFLNRSGTSPVYGTTKWSTFEVFEYKL